MTSHLTDTCPAETAGIPAGAATGPTEEAGQDVRWHTSRRRVAWSDTDPSGAYQFTAAMRYVEDAEVELLRELGVLDQLYPHIPRVAVEARFLRPCYFEELLDIDVRVTRVGRSSISYAFRIRGAAAVRAEGTLVSAYVGSGGTPAPVPAEARAVLRAAFPSAVTVPAEATATTPTAATTGTPAAAGRAGTTDGHA